MKRYDWTPRAELRPGIGSEVFDLDDPINNPPLVYRAPRFEWDVLDVVLAVVYLLIPVLLAVAAL